MSAAIPPLHVIVLAAGQGTRMKSALPKVLHPVGGKPMLAHVLETAQALGASACHVVHGHGAQAVRDWHAAQPAAGAVHWVLQAEQLGTAHAVIQALPGIPDAAQVMILYGDVPLISATTLQALQRAGAHSLALVTVRLGNPRGYGRILRGADGEIRGIVEENDASAEQKQISEINTGLMSAPAARLKDWLARVGNHNAKGEYYLTDVVALAVAAGHPVVAVVAASAEEVEGVNDRVQLARAERHYQRTQAERLLREGVQIADPARFDLRGTLACGRDVQIDVGAVLEGQVALADGVRIGPYCLLRNVRLGPDSVVEAHSVLDGVHAGAGVHIGPFARLRPGTELADQARIGNFVETKQARIGRGSKVNHLSYIGDAELGQDVNVGAGTITCNYDGANKHQTRIGDQAFIGSNSALVAPLDIGAGATVGAGSTLTKDAPAGQLTVARGKQITVTGWKRPVKAGSKPAKD
jgi:bifunctional UDP-N-acetylglucosamine pyrophosphorylase / glucosamine-1-phosphate N-acetyltransferase